MRGVLIRATADYGHLHPDVTNYIVGSLGMLYSLDRRRFMMEHPGEIPPAELLPLGDGWIRDLLDLHTAELIAIRKQAERNNH